MSIEEACFSILGDRVAHDIINEMGVHWAVVAAMSSATTADDPAAIAAIKAHTTKDRS